MQDQFAQIANSAFEAAVLQNSVVAAGGLPLSNLYATAISLAGLAADANLLLGVTTPDDKTSYYLVGMGQMGAGQMVGYSNDASNEFDSFRGWFDGRFTQAYLATDTDFPHHVWVNGGGLGASTEDCASPGFCTLSDFVPPSSGGITFTLKYLDDTDIDCFSSDVLHCMQVAGLDGVEASGWSDEFKNDMRDIDKALAVTALNMCGLTAGTQPLGNGTVTTFGAANSCDFEEQPGGSFGLEAHSPYNRKVVDARTDYTNWDYGFASNTNPGGSPDVTVNITNSLGHTPNDTTLQTFVDSLDDCLKDAFDSYLSGDAFAGCDTAGSQVQCGPTVPNVNFHPLNVGAPTDKFPFGLFSFAQDTLSPVVASAEAPSFDVGVSLPGVGDGSMHVDLSPLDPYMATMRLLMSIGLSLTAVYMFASSVLGFKAGSPGGGLEVDE